MEPSDQTSDGFVDRIESSTPSANSGAAQRTGAISALVEREASSEKIGVMVISPKSAINALP